MATNREICIKKNAPISRKGRLKWWERVTQTNSCNPYFMGVMPHSILKIPSNIPSDVLFMLVKSIFMVNNYLSEVLAIFT